MRENRIEEIWNDVKCKNSITSTNYVNFLKTMLYFNSLEIKHFSDQLPKVLFPRPGVPLHSTAFSEPKSFSLLP